MECTSDCSFGLFPEKKMDITQSNNINELREFIVMYDRMEEFDLVKYYVGRILEELNKNKIKTARLINSDLFKC